MEILKWDESLTLGIPIIDKQHQSLFRLVDNLLAGALNSAQEDLDDIFRRLYDYTESHFAFEEKLFYNLGYQGEAIHRQQHRELKESLAQVYEKYKTGNSQASDLMEFLLTWITGHISVEDRKYASILKEKIIAIS